MPAALRAEWPCYRLVLDRLATYTEVTTTMSIDDVDLMNIASDIYGAARHGD